MSKTTSQLLYTRIAFWDTQGRISVNFGFKQIEIGFILFPTGMIYVTQKSFDFTLIKNAPEKCSLIQSTAIPPPCPKLVLALHYG